MEANEWVCGRDETSWRRRDGPKRRRLCGRVINFFFLWSHRGLLSRVFPTIIHCSWFWGKSFVAPHGWWVKEWNGRVCHWSETSYDLRRVALLPLFVFLIQGFIFLRIFVNTLVAHGMAKNCIGDRSMKEVFWGQRWTRVYGGLGVRVGVHWTKGKPYN